MPSATGQKTNLPFDAGTASITTVPSACSSATTVLPPTIGCVEPSIIVPPIELEADCSETSPACRTGFSRYCPLPCTTTEAQASKSIFKSFVCPEPTVKFPPAICPDGILIPVCDSDESCNAWGVLAGSLVSIRQLATLPHLLLFTLALFGANTTRICWYVPGSISAEPSMARKHSLAALSKSTCNGLSFKPEARCIHPASLAEALALW